MLSFIGTVRLNCLEFLPAKTRAVTHCLLQVHSYHVLKWIFTTSNIIHCLQFAWAGGAIMEALLVLVVMTHFKEHGWRWLFEFSALPLGFLLLILPVRMKGLPDKLCTFFLLLIYTRISKIFDYKWQGD